MLCKVDAEDLALVTCSFAVVVQEKQQKGQEEQDGGRKKDTQEWLHVILCGTYLLGALELANKNELGGAGKMVSKSLLPLHYFYPYFFSFDLIFNYSLRPRKMNLCEIQ